MRIIAFLAIALLVAGFAGLLKIVDFALALETPDWLVALGALFICLGLASVNFPKEREPD